MSKWVETITYMSSGTELDFIYIRTIFKLNRFSLSESIRIVKYIKKVGTMVIPRFYKESVAQ